MATVQPQDDIQPKVEETQNQVDIIETQDPQIETQNSETKTTEATSTEEDNQNKKPWKKTHPRRKKSNADEQSSEVAQWPTPEEVRNLNTTTNQSQTIPASESKQSRRYNRNSSRSKKVINWKPLEVPNNGAPADATATTTTGPAPISNYSNGPRSNKRRGGHRGGRGGYSTGYSQNNQSRGGSNQQTQQQSPEANQQTVPAPSSESPGIEAVSTVNSQNNTDQNQSGNPQGEPRQFRNNRWGNRGRGQSFGRGQGFFGPKYGSRQNDKSVPQQPRVIPSDLDQLRDVIRHQVEYYFSTDNLCKDLFLRENMDKKEGWISIYMILNFRKVRELVNSEKDLLVDSVKDSALIEVSPDASHYSQER
jgi:chemotaxis protein histidine kinase CheA